MLNHITKDLVWKSTSEKKIKIVFTKQKMRYTLFNLMLPVFCHAALQYQTCSPTEDLYLKKLPEKYYMTWETPITIKPVTYQQCFGRCLKEKCNFAIHNSNSCILRKYSRFRPSTRFIRNITWTTLERTLCSEPAPGKRVINRPYHQSTSCHQVKAAGGVKSGVYEVGSKDNIYLSQEGTIREMRYLLCDMEESGGGWTVIQKNRKGSQVNFNVGNNLYEKGFGDLRESFWAGNQLIHELTRDKDTELLIILEQQDGSLYKGFYDEFHIANATDGYRLHVAEHSATKSTLGAQFTLNNGNIFGEDVCASHISSRWWSSQPGQYNTGPQCAIVNLNGNANLPCHPDGHKGIAWISATVGIDQSFKCFKGSTMMIRKRTIFNQYF